MPNSESHTSSSDRRANAVQRVLSWLKDVLIGRTVEPETRPVQLVEVKVNGYRTSIFNPGLFVTAEDAKAMRAAIERDEKFFDVEWWGPVLSLHGPLRNLVVFQRDGSRQQLALRHVQQFGNPFKASECLNVEECLR